MLLSHLFFFFMEVYVSIVVISPNAKPNAIGKGKPGKISLFSSIKNVITAPAQMPIIDVIAGSMLFEKLKNIVPSSTE